DGVADRRKGGREVDRLGAASRNVEGNGIRTGTRVRALDRRPERTGAAVLGAGHQGRAGRWWRGRRRRRLDDRNAARELREVLGSWIPGHRSDEEPSLNGGGREEAPATIPFVVHHHAREGSDIGLAFAKPRRVALDAHEEVDADGATDR